MNQLTMSDIQFNFSNVTIALQIGNDGKAQLTFTPTQTTELYANTVHSETRPAAPAAPAIPAQPSAEAVAALVQQSAAIIQNI